MDNVTPATAFDSFWSAVAKAEQEGRGGGGTIGKVRIAFGWKLFPKKDTGLTQEESFFEYNVLDPDSIKAARKAANKFVVEHGLGKVPSNVFMMRIYKDHILSKKVEWQEDRNNFMFLSSQPYTEVVAPHLQQAGVVSLGDMWAKWSWGEDKSDPTRMQMVEARDPVTKEIILDENGEPKMIERWPMYPYITEVYASEADAREAVAGIDTQNGRPAPDAGKNFPPMPDGYDLSTWESVCSEVRKLVDAGTPKPKIVKDYGLLLEQVNQIVG